MEITLRAYGKINLGLDVARRLPNGYHEVDMIMQSVGIWDDLTFAVTDDGAIEILPAVDGVANEDNIIYKACRLVKDTYGIERGVTVTLGKHIPVAAGMAGGSTDAAAALKAMNELFGLGLSQEQLMELGVKLGADVPYCIMGGTARAAGIGEILTPLAPMPECFILIAKPPVSVSTAAVYKGLKVDELAEHPDIDGMAAAIASGSLGGITSRMANVLETVTIPMHPEIESIKDVMRKGGAANALMSGSGPTVFGIFEDETEAEGAAAGIRRLELAEDVFVVRPVNRK